MHPIVLFLHSLTRWVVLVLAVAALVRAALGLAQKRPFGKADARVGLFFMISVDLQVLGGLLLYAALSPTMKVVFAAFGAAMKDRILRFWAVEHGFAMLFALTFAHVGRVMVRKADGDAAKHKRALVWFGLALLALLAGIPWPFLPYGRPLLSLP